MSTQRKSVLKNWFRKGLIPTQAQFADVFDSFFHKSEDQIPLSSVAGLSARLESERTVLQDYLNVRLRETMDNIDSRVNAPIENSEMDNVLEGDVAVYLTDINGVAVLGDDGRPIEIIE